MPPHFNPIQPLNVLPELPFFPSEMLTHLNPIFMPWETTQQAQEQPFNQVNPQAPPPQPHEMQEPGQAEAVMEKEIEEHINIGSEQLLDFSNLDGIKVYLFTKMQEKRHVLNCP